MLASHRVFEALEEPTGAEEDWRYVEFDTPFSSLVSVDSPGAPLAAGPFLTSVGRTSGRALIVDGAVLEASSEGGLIRRFGELDDDPGLGGNLPVDHNKLTAAHAAFSADGVLIEIPTGSALSDPLIIEIQGVTEETASFPHVVVRVAENAEASVLVVYRSAEGARLLLVPEIDLDVAAGGRLRYLAVQGLDHAATSVVHQRVTLGRDATARIGEVGLGAKLGRLDLGVRLTGDGSSSEVVGLYFGEGEQTLDYRMVVTHEGKSTTSDVFLKGAVEDDAQSVFTGLLRIEKDARGTSTFETNRNLVLSENAKAQSVPNLEILCDDVVCGHASSVGPLEQEHLYYLQSRGLTRVRAERLLIRGFFQEVIDRLPIEAVGGPVSEEVFRRFVSAQEEGRVA
ncbi:MAG TPA: Fe-S cluster assembly protein SufD [Acidimicrobiia bacterium]|nr:Fe-S cluster assembly protein SufD [Acidimicrobiia bacterium]